MQSRLPMHRSRRCGARTRSGSPCQSPAMPNDRCRLHGGKSPGAPKGNRNALKHGRYTAEALARRREIGLLVRAIKGLASRGDAEDLPAKVKQWWLLLPLAPPFAGAELPKSDL